MAKICRECGAKGGQAEKTADETIGAMQALGMMERPVTMSLGKARKIAAAINQRDGMSQTAFRIWDVRGECVATPANISIPKAKLLYTGQGWEYGDRVTAKWVREKVEQHLEQGGRGW